MDAPRKQVSVTDQNDILPRRFQPPMIGRTIAHYQVTDRLGAGGMGEVYRARDSKLGRDVALKVLPEVFARDPDRLMRFEREARLLASLNHANLAVIHGIEQDADRRV